MIITFWFLRDILLWNNNYTSMMEQHLITAVTVRDYLHWIIKSSLFIGWCYTWTYTSLIIIHLSQNAIIYVPEVTLCMDTYCLDKVVDWDVIIDEGTPCAWSHIIAVDHATALQLIIHTCCSYVMWLDTLHWRNVLTWNIVTSLNDIAGATVRSNAHRSCA